MKLPKPVAIFLVAIATPVIAQDDVSATIVAANDATIVYVFPTSPQTFVPIAGLPSFLAMPGAPVPAIATQVVYTAPQPAELHSSASIVSPGTVLAPVLDCSSFVGVVRLVGPDRFNLDHDGDGVGCEPEDR